MNIRYQDKDSKTTRLGSVKKDKEQWKQEWKDRENCREKKHIF